VFAWNIVVSLYVVTKQVIDYGKLVTVLWNCRN